MLCDAAACSVAHGYEVAIASAGCKTEFVQSFLQRRVDADIFTDEFLNSTAFQARCARQCVSCSASSHRAMHSISHKTQAC